MSNNNKMSKQVITQEQTGIYVAFKLNVYEDNVLPWDSMMYYF